MNWGNSTDVRKLISRVRDFELKLDLELTHELEITAKESTATVATTKHRAEGVRIFV